jgi:hypothetical protein
MRIKLGADVIPIVFSAGLNVTGNMFGGGPMWILNICAVTVSSSLSRKMENGGGHMKAAD